MRHTNNRPAKARTFEVIRYMSFDGLNGIAAAVIFAQNHEQARGLASSGNLRVGGYPSSSKDWDAREIYPYKAVKRPKRHA